MEPERPFKVLFIEDCKEICELYRDMFSMYSETYELFFADGVDDGFALLEQHPDVDMIVVDGELSPLGNWGKDFVKRARPVYKGPMLASSSSREMNEEMLSLGCNYATNKKDTVPHNVRKILKGARGPAAT